MQTVPETQVIASQGANWFILMVPTGGKGYGGLRDASNHIYSIKNIQQKLYIFLSLKLVCQIIARVAYAVTFSQ